MGLAETGRRWHQLNKDDQLPFRFCGHFPRGQLSTNAAFNRHDSNKSSYQIGRTASFTCGQFVSYRRKGGTDPLRLGRYSWQLFSGKGGVTMR
eukprot:13507077-Ditylum_brightwellii.AAC.1